MSEQTHFIKVTDRVGSKRKVSYLVNVKEVQRASFFTKKNGKLIYYVDLYEDDTHIRFLHFISQKDFERLKKL